MHLDFARQVATVSGMSFLNRIFLSVLPLFWSAAEASDFATLPTPRNETVVCVGVDGDIRFDVLVEIPNLADAPMASSMRASDPNVSPARAEIAMFEAQEGLLDNDNGVIVGHVDSSNPKTARKGERIGGTTLGQLSSVMLSLDVDFSIAASPLKKYSAQVVYLKKSSERLVQDLDCTRQK